VAYIKTKGACPAAPPCASVAARCFINAGEAPMTPSNSNAPGTVRAAVAMIWAGAVLSLVGIVAILIAKDDIRQMVEARYWYSNIDVEATINTVIVMGILVTLVTTGLWIWMAIMSGLGRNWARITGTVFGGLQIASSALLLAANGSGGYVFGSKVDHAELDMPLATFASVGSMLLAVAIIVLIWNGKSSRWFEAMGNARQAKRQVVYAVPAGS
jgi:hypothetical protein